MSENKEDVVAVELLNGNVYLNWASLKFGCGQLSFSFDPATGKLTCMNERMSRERVRQILYALADHIAYDAEFVE